ncbi:hypothetical protein GGR51DRAFT_572692 [Nemania sp. FL0031]|nr:hypothetical protein GGR51DRAFT_572692 [Nemania sp. FL0031]
MESWSIPPLPPLPHNYNNFPNRPELPRIATPESQITRETFHVPVVFPVFGEGRLHNTVQVRLSRNRRYEYYNDFVDGLLTAGYNVLINVFKGNDDRAVEARLELERCMLRPPGCVYFVWDFARPIKFTETGYTMPAYGTSSAFGLPPELLSEHFQAAYMKRISYIFIAVEITENGVGRPGLRELSTLPRREKEEKKKEKRRKKRARLNSEVHVEQAPSTPS